jgi:transcriptional regulator with XRE-family HTH domain
MNATTPTIAAEAVHPVDLHVGLKVREFRRARGLSQSALGDAIGVSFQQVQKYERGANRVSASMLFEIAGALKVQPAVFYEDLGAKTAPLSPQAREAHEFALTSPGHNLLIAGSQATSRAVAAAAHLLEEARRP